MMPRRINDFAHVSVGLSMRTALFRVKSAAVLPCKLGDYVPLIERSNSHPRFLARLAGRISYEELRCRSGSMSNEHPNFSRDCFLTARSRKFHSLQPRTRMLIGLGAIGYSALGIAVSNGAEKHFDMVATEEDKERLRRAIPKITTLVRDKE